MLPIRVLSIVVLVLVFGIPTAHGLYTKYCAKFTAKKTNDANKYYCSCKFMMCPADYAYIDGCENNSGQQLIRLLDDDGIQWSSSQSFRSTCGKGAEIRNFFARINACQVYTVRIGCVGSTACGGRIRIRVSNTTFPVALSSSRTNLRLQSMTERLEKEPFDDANADEGDEVEVDTTPDPRRLLGDTSTGLGTSGYCDDATSLTLGAIVALIVVPFLCCCACCFVGHRLLVNRKQMQVVPDGLTGSPPSPRNSFNYFLQIPLVPAMFVTTTPQPQPASSTPGMSASVSSPSSSETAAAVVSASIVPTAYAYVRPSSGSGRSFNMSSRRAYAFLPTLSAHPSAEQPPPMMALPETVNNATVTSGPASPMSRPSPSTDQQPSPRLTVIVSSSTEADNSGSGGVQSSRSTNANSPYLQPGSSSSESLDATVVLAALRIPPPSSTSSSTAPSPSWATVSSPSPVSGAPVHQRLAVRQRSLRVTSPRYAVTCPTTETPSTSSSSQRRQPISSSVPEQALYIASVEDETEYAV